MKKRILFSCFALFAAFVVISSTCCRAIDTDFSPEKVKSYLELGRKYESYEELTNATRYELSSPDTPDIISITTMRAWLAYISFDEWQKYKEPDPGFIKFLLIEPRLNISIFAYGEEYPFATDVNVVLLQGSKVIQPVELKNKDFYGYVEKKKMYGKLVTAEFRYDSFDPNAMTRIAWCRDGKKYYYEADFSKLE